MFWRAKPKRSAKPKFSLNSGQRDRGIEQETKGNGKEVCYVDFLAKEPELEVMILNTGVRQCQNNEITLDNAKSR